MAEVAWTEEARRWLQEIYDYIAEDNEESAYRMVCAIYERAEILLNSPELGYRHREQPLDEASFLVTRSYAIAW